MENFCQACCIVGPLAAAAPQPTQSGSGSVGRLAVQSLGSHSWGAEFGSPASAAAILQTVHRLKGIASGSRMAVMVSVPTGNFDACLSLTRSSETGFSYTLEWLSWSLCQRVLLMPV